MASLRTHLHAVLPFTPCYPELHHRDTPGSEGGWEVWSPFRTAYAQINFGSSITTGKRKWILGGKTAAVSQQESLLWPLGAGEFLSTSPFSHSQKLFSSTLLTESRNWTYFYSPFSSSHILWAPTTSRWREQCHKRKESRISKGNL